MQTVCRLWVCAGEKKTSPVCSAMTRQFLPATLQIHKSTHKHTQVHTLLQASPVCLWLAHTCRPDQRARVSVQRPSMHVDSHEYKTHVHALAAFAGSLIGLIMIFLLSSGDFTRPNKAVSPSWPSLDLSFSSHRHTTMFSSPFLSYEIR